MYLLFNSREISIFHAIDNGRVDLVSMLCLSVCFLKKEINFNCVREGILFGQPKNRISQKKLCSRCDEWMSMSEG